MNTAAGTLEAQLDGWFDYCLLQSTRQSLLKQGTIQYYMLAGDK